MTDSEQGQYKPPVLRSDEAIVILRQTLTLIGTAKGCSGSDSSSAPHTPPEQEPITFLGRLFGQSPGVHSPEARSQKVASGTEISHFLPKRHVLRKQSQTEGGFVFFWCTHLFLTNTCF
jgi:hypothetical protein